MIEDRDPAFWLRVFNHPEVAMHVSLGAAWDAEGFVTHPSVTPLRAINGGYLFARIDGAGLIYDLHAAFLPSGWGREAAATLKSALAAMFARGAQIVTVCEVCGWWRSRPPLSFGFRAAGDFQATPQGVFRSWFLTRAAWERSPACRRMV